jgi:predicted dehydrogenase
MAASGGEEIRIGIIGVGGMGSAHGRRLVKGEVPGAVLAAVCDADPKRVEAFPEAPGFNDAGTLLAKAKPDAVIIATPHYDHVPLGIRALDAGVHVLVEKPIAVHKADAERLIAAYRNPDQVFAAMFNQRTDPRYRWVRDRMADGTLGRINRVSWTITDWFRTATYYQNGAWRATWAGEGGGVLLNQCPHQLDLWQWLFGMPDRVHAHCHRARFHEIEVEDDVTAYLEYDNGMNGVFITTTGEAPGTNRLEIAAENGKVVIEGSDIVFDRNLVSVSEFSASSDKPFDKPETERETISMEGTGEQHLGILRNFCAAIRGEAPLVAPATEGIHSVELANAMLYSGLNETLVKMPLDGAVYEAYLKELIATSTFRKTTVKRQVSSAEDMEASF